jgi:cell division protein DivIC
VSEPARVLRESYIPRTAEEAPAIRPERRKSFNLAKSKLPNLVFVLLLCYLAVACTSQFSKLYNMERDVVSIREEVEYLKQRNADLRQELQTVQSDAYIEKTAREKLGLIKQGETRVLTVAPGTELPVLETPSGPPPPIE